MALAIFTTACCGCRKNKNLVPLTVTEWSLTQLNGESVTSDNYRMTLSNDGTISGIGDCNRFSGSFTLSAGESNSNGKLTVGENLVSTRMMCLNQARETAFLKMLGEIDSWSIDGERLMLIRSGDVLAIFEIAPAPAQ
jgi:heat shock protein HslJ